MAGRAALLEWRFPEIVRLVVRHWPHRHLEAIERAGEIRFLPILLTSATAIGGLLPLAVQNIGLYSPMAWVIIGGLLTSTFLARLVTPVVYKLIPPSGHEPAEQDGGAFPDLP